MTWVVRREGEDIDHLLNRFRRNVLAAGIAADFKRHISFQTSGELRRAKSRKAAVRRAKARKSYERWLERQR